MQRGLNIRQKKFVKHLLAGKNKTESAILAGYNPHSASVMGSVLSHNDNIIKALDRAGITDTVIAKTIKSHIVNGIGIKDTADTSLKATELSLRLKGYLTSKDNDNSNTTNNYITMIKGMSNEQLQDKLSLLVTDIDTIKDNSNQ